ncbi:hypothetical protein CFP56_043597 [Quercus suber]|uniref:Uncharacterized protein n=1 Tax=Quercus suber TaxID=58331 RepID=A0AAW0IQP9_QUESU
MAPEVPVDVLKGTNKVSTALKNGYSKGAFRPRLPLQSSGTKVSRVASLGLLTYSPKTPQH